MCRFWIFSLLFIACLTTGVRAQQAPTAPMGDTLVIPNAKVQIGVQAGWVIANCYGSDLSRLSADASSSSLHGFTAGVYLLSMPSQYFWLRHELNFRQGGATIALHDDTNGNYASRLRTAAVELLPFSPTLRYKGLQVHAGMYISALVAASVLRRDERGNEYADSDIFGKGDETSEDNKFLQKFDAGIAAGAAWQFACGLQVGVRYAHGFIPVFEDANAHTFGQPDRVIRIYHQSWQFTAGYTLGTRRR